MLWITICCHFHFDAYSLTNQRRANAKVIYLGSLMLMPQQQHYTCHILRSLSTTPSQAPGGGGYSHTLPIRVRAAQRGRDFEAPGLERGIHFRGVF